MKAKKTPINSRIYLREKMLDELLPRLQEPGKITVLEAWELCKHVPGMLSYDVCRAVFHSIMLEMIYQGFAGYTKKRGEYGIRKRDEVFNPERIPVPVREKYEPPDPVRTIIRPPATKSTQELLLEKYLVD